MAKKEPQSYGSQSEWVKGDTGEKVNDNKSTPPPEHEDFYDDKRESEVSDPHQGGDISPVQLAENAAFRARTATDDTQPVSRLTDTPSGAKRNGYFKNRDYK